jgi:hypothetical protein
VQWKAVGGLVRMGGNDNTSEEQISDHIQYIALFDRLFSCFVPINIKHNNEFDQN